jgi:hypothetical protein
VTTSQPVPIIRQADVTELAPLVFGFTVDWGPYVAEVEARCRRIAEAGDEPLLVVVAADRYLAWCAVNNCGPNSSTTLHWYAQSRCDEGDAYEVETTVAVPLQTAELDRLAEQISMASLGPEAAGPALDRAQTVAEQLVRAAGAGIPADGWIRVNHPAAPFPAEGRFDTTSLDIGAERSFATDVFELLCSHTTIACLTGGSLSAEQFSRRQLGFVVWTMTSQEIEGLSGPQAADHVTRNPGTVPEGVDPTTAFDAPVELDPLR